METIRPTDLIQNETPEPSGWLASLIKKFKKRRGNGSQCKKRKGQILELQIPDKNEKKTLTYDNAHSRCLMCPEVTESLRFPAQTQSPSKQLADGSLRLYLPFVFSEYKRNSTSTHQAVHQIQMYCTFGVECLASLGITDFPVWGIVTAGTEGEIVMAWKSTKSAEDDELDNVSS